MSDVIIFLNVDYFLWTRQDIIQHALFMELCCFILEVTNFNLCMDCTLWENGPCCLFFQVSLFYGDKLHSYCQLGSTLLFWVNLFRSDFSFCMICVLYVSPVFVDEWGIFTDNKYGCHFIWLSKIVFWPLILPSFITKSSLSHGYFENQLLSSVQLFVKINNIV